MKDNLTEIVAILDRSGSMAGHIGENIQGFNSFVAAQRALPGELHLSLTIFDNETEFVYDGVNGHTVPPLTSERYFARNTTALYDAICQTVDRVGDRLANTPEENRPSQVIVLIMTDGLENASKHFTAADVRTRIETQQNQFNWQFTFIGANQDAIVSAGQIGINANAALTYSQRNTGQTYSTISQSVSNTRLMGSAVSYSDQDRASVQ